MESDGACEIFVRSVSKHGLKYTTFIGDGNTGCFGKVQRKLSEVYGSDYLVVKEECVGHVQKRMGSGLREYKHKKRGIKLSDGKTAGGKGRLTDVIIDKIQNYYGEAIRNNSGDLNSMKNAIWAIYNHMIIADKLSLDEQHSLCPKAINSWCKYWSNRGNYNDANRLPSIFLDEIRPIFTNLTNNELLKRCLKGFTQNQNESTNGILWSKCPKTKFCGRTKVLLAVSETIMHFNTGAGSRVSVLSGVGVAAGRNMLTALRKEDNLRVAVAA